MDKRHFNQLTGHIDIMSDARGCRFAHDVCVKKMSSIYVCPQGVGYRREFVWYLGDRQAPYGLCECGKVGAVGSVQLRLDSSSSIYSSTGESTPR